MSVQALAQDFDTNTLLELAQKARHQARLICELERKPWRRTLQQNTAIDAFQQLARYCERVLEIQRGDC